MQVIPGYRCRNSRRAWIFAICRVRAVVAITRGRPVWGKKRGIWWKWATAFGAWAGYLRCWRWNASVSTTYCPSQKTEPRSPPASINTPVVQPDANHASMGVGG